LITASRALAGRVLALSAIERDHGPAFRGKLHEQLLKRSPVLAQLEAGAKLVQRLLHHG
jgi:hypothetical protein